MILVNIILLVILKIEELENEVKIKKKSRRKCQHENCKKIPCFNYEGESKAIYCSEHKLENMIDIVSKKCIECNDVRVNPKYKNHCLRCFIYKFPDKPITKNYKVKEHNMLLIL